MKKLFLVCCLAAFCTCNAMAQETVDSTMVDSTAIEALPLDWSSVASTPPVAVTVSLGFCAW